MWQFNQGKIKLPYLVVALALTLWGYLLIINYGVRTEKYLAYDAQVEAAELMQASMNAIRDKKLSLGLDIDPIKDPNETGLMGIRFSEITTSKGVEEAKRATTSPSFAALLVKYFTELELKPGDVVAIGASGSFPALSLATLSACQAMDLAPIFIYSIGASNYGANIPEFTFVEMLKTLNEKGIIHKYIDAISMGGAKDIGEGLTDEGRAIILDIINNSGVEKFIYEDELKDSIDARISFYFERAGSKNIKCFVCIGGNPANNGSVSAINHFFNGNNGLVRKVPVFSPNDENGVEYEFSLLGLPIIHLLEVRNLATKHNMLVDPSPFPTIGTDGVFFITKYNKFMIALVIVIMVLVFMAGVYKPRKSLI